MTEENTKQEYKLRRGRKRVEKLRKAAFSRGEVLEMSLLVHILMA